MDHQWPKPDDPEQHVWSEWLQAARTDAPGGATQYRTCIHPKCSAIENRKAPLG